MVAVDLRDEERHVRVHAVILRVREHRGASIGIKILSLAGHGRIETGEDHSRFEIVAERAHHEVGSEGRHRRIQPPLGGIAIALSGTALRGHDLMKPEPGMSLQELNETLPHGAGGAEDGDRDPLAWLRAGLYLFCQ
jgi:hypothetical protein